MSKPKLSRWFPASVKPVRNGAYQFREWLLPGRTEDDPVQLAYWGGRKWFFFADRSLAVCDRSVAESGGWRGLAFDPKETA